MDKLTISERSQFLRYLAEQDEELSARVKALERELIETFELRESTQKLLHALRSGALNRRLG